MNKINRGQDATYQQLKFYTFQFENFEVGLLCFYFPTCVPRGGSSFDLWDMV